MTTQTDYSEFISDSTLQAMLELSERDLRHWHALNKHFSDDQLTLGTRWGFRTGQEQRALSILQHQVEEAPIAEKLKACLYALSVDTNKVAGSAPFLSPKIQSAAQLMLNELLLANPILMHPLVRVHIYEQEVSGVCSVAHAIAASPRARFPMRRDGVTREQQAAWLSHRLVVLGFATLSSPHPKLHLLASSKTAAAVLRHTRHWPAPVIASLHELSEATRQEGDSVVKYTTGLIPSDPRKHGDDLGTGVYTMSLLRAMGVVDGERYPELLDSSKALEMSQWPLFTQRMTNLLSRHIFAGMDGAVVHGTVAERTRLLLDGLVQAGYAEDRLKAAWLLADSIATRGTRKLSTPEVIEFLREFKATGAPFLDGIAFGTIGSSTEWLEAAEALRREDAMLNVIGEVTAPPGESQSRRRLKI